MKKEFCFFIFVLVLLISSCATMEKRYQDAKGYESISLCREFLEKYPNSEYAEEIQKKLIFLEYKEAKKRNTIQRYRSFLTSYSNNIYSLEIRTLLDNLLWHNTNRSDTLSLQSFIQENPKSAHIKLARSIIDSLHYENQLQQRFNDTWKMLDSPEDRIRYLTDQAQNEHRNKVYFFDALGEAENQKADVINWQDTTSFFFIKDIRPFNTREISGKCIISGSGALRERTKLRTRSPREVIEVDYIGPKEKGSKTLTMSNTMIMTFNTTSADGSNKYEEPLEGTMAFFNDGALWKKVPISLESGKFEQGWAVPFEDIFVSALCSTDKNIAIEPIISGRKYFLCPAGTHGSIHRLIGEMEIGDYTFIGENNPIFPLTFLLHKDYGYVYLRGKGSVILPNGDEIIFNDKIDNEWLMHANELIRPFNEQVINLNLNKLDVEKNIPGSTPKFVVYDDPPFPIKKVPPEYPDDSKNNNIEGEVWLEVEVLNDGTVGAVEVKKSLDSSSGGLDEAAIIAVKQWEFYPAKSAGKPVACWVTFPIKFDLK